MCIPPKASFSGPPQSVGPSTTHRSFSPLGWCESGVHDVGNPWSYSPGARADPNITNAAGRSALFLATTPGKAEALRKAGADPTACDHKGMTPLIYHARQGRLQMVKWFARYKKNRQALSRDTLEALANLPGRSQAVVNFLLERIATPQATNNE